MIITEPEWYEGQITAYDAQKGYHVVYEDGEEQWEEFEDDGSNFVFLESAKEVLHPTPSLLCYISLHLRAIQKMIFKLQRVKQMMNMGTIMNRTHIS